MPPKQGKKARKVKKRDSRKENVNIEGMCQHEGEARPQRSVGYQAQRAMSPDQIKSIKGK